MSEEQFDYSAYEDKPAEDKLAQLSYLADEQRKVEDDMKRLEKQMAALKDRHTDLSERRIPQLMDEIGMEEFSTSTGTKIAVKENIRASIPKGKQAEAFAWLEANGHSRLIKREFNIQFGKEEEKWANKFEGDLKRRKKPLNVTRKKSVHPSTLSSFVKEKLAEGEAIPMEALGVFRQRVAKIGG